MGKPDRKLVQLCKDTNFTGLQQLQDDTRVKI